MSIILRSGSQSELNSTISSDQVALLSSAEGVVQGEEGGIISSELYLVVDAIKRSTNTDAKLGGSFTQIVFEFKINAGSLGAGIVMALVIGLLGGFFPALRAARMSVTHAFARVS